MNSKQYLDLLELKEKREEMEGKFSTAPKEDLEELALCRFPSRTANGR